MDTDEDAVEVTPESVKKKSASTKRKIDIEQPEKNVKKTRIRNIMRQPTNEELTQLRETENLFNSNLFRMQIDEILKEVQIKQKTVTRLTKWLEQFNNHMSKLKIDDCEYNLDDKTCLKMLNVKSPTTFDSRETHARIKFTQCEAATIIGSYDLGCAINANLTIDLEIKMSASMFSKNDSVNYRYHKKKSAYLAFLSSHISESDLVGELNYSFLNRSELQPVLLIKPVGKLGETVGIRLYLSCDENVFKLSRLDLTRNNVRESWYFNETIQSAEQTGPPTPYYNASILCDLTQDVNKRNVKRVLSECENLKAAILLLKIWLRQRKLDVSGYIITMFVVYLIQTRRVNNIMSSYQIVRNVWISLSTSTWDKKGISLADKNSQSPPLNDFHKEFPVVFVDYTGYYNICWHMSASAYNSLKNESLLAVEMLDNSSINSFIPLFMTPFKFEMQYDDVFSFKNSANLIKIIYSTATRSEKLNYGPDKYYLVIRKLTELLNKGLNDRIQLIQDKPLKEFVWSSDKSLKKAKKSSVTEDICFGLIMNPVNCMNIVDKGPEANLAEAEVFREFWGEKSELRRFQDGSITEACVWQADTMAEKRLIVKQIVEYLLDTKFGIQEELFYIADQLDSVLVPKDFIMKNETIGTGEEAAIKVLEAFHSLRNEMRNINDLPLFINSVYGTSPVFSYCDPLPPLAECSPNNHQYLHKDKCCLMDTKNFDTKYQCPRYVKTSNAIIELGHSGKWPGNLEAFRRLKAAFCLQIAENLWKQYSLPTHVFPHHFVVLKDGYVFKMEIVHPKEVLLSTRYTEGGVVKFKETEESLELKCCGVYLPRLRGSLHGLHQKYPSYGSTVSLVKRFLRAHMLDANHIPDLVVELLVAKIFLLPQPYSPPAQPRLAFQRFLHVVGNTDWSSELVILNFNEDFSREVLNDIERRFNADRSTFPPLSIVTSSEGEDYSVWSKKAPDLRTLAFVSSLCKVALEKVENELFSLKSDNVLSIFKPSLSNYDVLIRLDPKLVPNYGAKLDVEPNLKVLEPPTKHDKIIPILEFDPVALYLKEIREAYSDFALFFHDSYGGDCIGVVWKPSSKLDREFQVLNSSALKPKKNKFVTNFQAITEDFKIIGKGLVVDVVLNSKIK